jgi:uncharacterized delta-60 repeat protein
VVALSENRLARFNADGSLDAGFGSGGVVRIAPVATAATDLAIQADGRILASGLVHRDGYGDLAVLRYNPDGSPDASFDGDGQAVVSFGETTGASALALALQPDGKIVAAGRSDGSSQGFVLARLNPDGSLDTSFDGDGRVTNAGGESAADVVVQGDGRIVVAGVLIGRTSDGTFAPSFQLARFGTDGALDPTFGSGGFVVTDRVSSGDRTEIARALALQGDGKIVATGLGFGPFSGLRTDFATARYLP